MNNIAKKAILSLGWMALALGLTLNRANNVHAINSSQTAYQPVTVSQVRADPNLCDDDLLAVTSQPLYAVHGSRYTDSWFYMSLIQGEDKLYPSAAWDGNGRTYTSLENRIMSEVNDGDNEMVTVEGRCREGILHIHAVSVDGYKISVWHPKSYD